MAKRFIAVVATLLIAGCDGSPAETAPAGPGATAAKAPPADAKTLGGHHYKVLPGPLTWHLAKRECESLGGHLVTLDTPDEVPFVKEIAKGQHLWLGATDEVQEGRWLWVSGAPADTSGASLDDAHGGQHHLCIGGDGLLSDAQSDLRIGFICEWDW